MAKQANAPMKPSAAASVAAAATEPDPITESGPLDSPTDHEEIARLAYCYWQARGCPDDSPEEDWFRAERELQQAVSVAA